MLTNLYASSVCGTSELFCVRLAPRSASATMRSFCFAFDGACASFDTGLHGSWPRRHPLAEVASFWTISHLELLSTSGSHFEKMWKACAASFQPLPSTSTCSLCFIFLVGWSSIWPASRRSWKLRLRWCGRFLGGPYPELALLYYYQKLSSGLQGHHWVCCSSSYAQTSPDSINRRSLSPTR